MQQSPENSSNNSLMLVGGIAIIAIVAAFAFFYSDTKQPEPVQQPIVEETLPPEPVVVEPVVEEIVEPEPEPIEPVTQEVVELEPEVIEDPLPLLSESDSWLKDKVTELTWRKELLRLIIDDDMIRRLVVFTDNFAQGIIAYEHSLLIKPSSKFTAVELDVEGNEQVWVWDDNATKRFNLYVELLRAFDAEKLVDLYFEMKPLIDEAYQELGYPDDDFTDTLQDAISRVLDMDLPKGEVTLVRPSVMYKYQDDSLESLPDAEKLLLRIGKENLLVIKSVLLEFSDKLGRRRAD